MPTVMRIGPYRFFFWSNERGQPPHVHVESGADYAKIWLDRLRVARSEGYNAKQLGRIMRLVEQHRDQLQEPWCDHFGSH